MEALEQLLAAAEQLQEAEQAYKLPESKNACVQVRPTKQCCATGV